MANHRKTERIKAMTFATVHDHHNDTLLGFLGNLTVQGAMIVGEKAMEREKEITLRIEFRDALDISETELIIPARVAWCREEDNIYFQTGFEFTGLSPQNEKTINAALEKYVFDRDILL